MLNIDIAVVSSIGKGGLQLITPGDTSNSDHNLNRTALGHAGGRGTLPQSRRYYSFDWESKGRILSTTWRTSTGEGNVSEEICPKCCKKFKCLSILREFMRMRVEWCNIMSTTLMLVTCALKRRNGTWLNVIFSRVRQRHLRSHFYIYLQIWIYFVFR